MASVSTAAATGQDAPRVFLSYSHDSPEHAARVLALALQFRRDGVDARLDQFEAFPPEGWPQWCARQILDSDYVVLICTATYRERFLGYEKPGSGRGVKWEGKILQNILYRDERNTRFQPVVFSQEDERFIPESVVGMTWTLLTSFGAADPGYTTLVQRFSGGRPLAPLPDLAPVPEPSRPPDASVATGEVADDLAIQLGKLDELIEGQKKLREEQEKLTAAQEKHERMSGKRQRVIVAGLVALAVCAVAGGPWIIGEIRRASAKTEAIVADPAVLRAKLEEKIDETFERKRGELLAAKAPPAEIDSLYRWRDRAKGQVAEGAAFITARVADPKSPIIGQAAKILNERGVDATLEFLDATLKAERQRRQEEGRQLAEASMMKANLHESRFETAEQERAIRDAIADAPDWWRPHNALGRILDRRAEWQPAEQEYEAARKTMGSEGEAVVLNNLAQLYHATNRLAQAEPLMERTLKIAEKSYGPDHPDVAAYLNNLAALYEDTNRLAQAEPLMERALKIDEKSFGPEHPNVARDLNNLAQLYEDTNRLAQAEPLMERALKIEEKSFGPEHPKVAIRLNNLATLYEDTNRLAQVEPLLERALKIAEQSYGPDHPDVAIYLNNLAQLYQATNRLAEAEPLLERALKIAEKSFGPEHPKVAIYLNNLAQVYEHTSRLAEAEPLMERALKITEKSFGPEHPDVAICLAWLAQLYQDTNRLAEAEPLMRRHLVIFLKFTRKTGHPHPHLNAAVSNYKALLAEMSLPETEIAQRLVATGREAGYTPEAFAELLKQLGP